MASRSTRKYLNALAEQGCVLCRWLGTPGTPAELHHPRTGTGASRRAPDSDVIGLCPEHHRGNTGIHGMGRKAFERHYGITELELLAYSKENGPGGP